jgi:hypothetical protein
MGERQDYLKLTASAVMWTRAVEEQSQEFRRQQKPNGTYK